ncbi:MAG TPA: ABC transporter substrate-binding protein [Chloroflexota bacterium]|nr:ABC transporter substrate-binding protein [Chloroflexota bacterium]
MERGSGGAGPGVSRRALLGTGAAALGSVAGGMALAACGQGAGTGGAGPASGTPGAGGGPRPVKVQFLWIKNVEFGGEWIADADGLYRQEGVQPEFLAGGPNVDGVAVVSAGGADVGLTGGFAELLDANAKGSDFVAFAASFQRSPGGILSLAQNPVNRPADLLKKRIGGQEGARIAVNAVLKLNGLEQDYSWIPVGFDPQPLIEGACDAYTCYVTNQPLVLAEKNIPYAAVTYSDLGFVSYGNVFFAKRAVLKEKRDTIVRYLRATIMGWELNARDPAKAARLAVEKYGRDLGLSLSQQIEQNKAQLALIESDVTKAKGLFWMDAERISGPIYKALEATGRTRLPKVEDFVDFSILQDAYGG